MVRFASLVAAALLCVVGLCRTLAADDKPTAGTASIVDASGTATDVKGLEFTDPGMGVFDKGWGCLAVYTTAKGGGLAIKIPLSSLVSVQVDGEVADAKFLYGGKETTVKGKWDCSGTLTGKGDFGDFSLAIAKLKKLTFTPAPTPAKDEKAPTLDSTLTLADGTTVKVADLTRHCVQNPTPRQRQRLNLHFDDFCFLRGESTVKLKMAEIKTIEFGKEDDVTVTLKSGKSATGKVVKDGGDGCLGFTGASELGDFHIDRSDVKSIQFAADSK